MQDIPRRNNLAKNLPAEKLIYTTIVEVERLGAHEELTAVVEKLSEAKELLADYLDERLVLIAKGNYKAKDGTIKPAFVIDGLYYALLED